VFENFLILAQKLILFYPIWILELFSHFHPTKPPSFLPSFLSLSFLTPPLLSHPNSALKDFQPAITDIT